MNLDLRSMRQLLVMGALLSLVVACSESRSGEVPEDLGAREALRSRFAPGVPSFGPLQRKGLQDAVYAHLDSERLDGSVDLVVGDDGGSQRYFVLHRRSDETVALSQVSFGLDEEGSLAGSFDVSGPGEPPAKLRVAARLSSDFDYVDFVIDTVAVVSSIAVGSSMPMLEIFALDEEQHRLPAGEAVVTVLNYWATSCAPCVEEIPQLNELAQDSKNEGVRFVAIALNSASEVQRFLEDRPFAYSQFTAGPEAASYLGEAFPRHTVINSKGIVVFDYLGYSPRIVADIRAALAANR